MTEAEAAANTLITEYEEGRAASRNYPTLELAANIAAAIGGRGYGYEHVDRYVAVVSGPKD